MAIHVRALHRFPVKGFGAQPCEALTVLPGGRIAGDRVLNFRFADAPVQADQWCKKYHGVVLVNTPGLAQLALTWDADQKRLKMSYEGVTLIEAGLDEAGRQQLVDALTGYVLSLDVNPLVGHPTRLPLKLVGDGLASRYQDNEAGQVSLHSVESLGSLAQALGDESGDSLGLRFRHNIEITGTSAWNELGWAGKRIQIGEVVFNRIETKVRCLATHVNPQTGQRDCELMSTLMQSFGQQTPTFGIGMLSLLGGVIRMGDSVRVLD